MVRRNSSAGTAILDSILPFVRSGDKDEGNGGRVLHVFAVAAAEQLYEVKELLQGLQLEGLSGEFDSVHKRGEIGLGCDHTTILSRSIVNSIIVNSIT